ncbi:sensory neuron membrane protein 2 [Calliopsis andreniformis]|uniref:sensory neuron membrane protein 2 n=1 Tax=Calliopsis andreniformis TaxID=337506 RepID=UPI003FCDFBB9
MVYLGALGAVLIVIGATINWGQFLVSQVALNIQKRLSLTEESKLYKVWSSPINLVFSCYLFNVTNPDEVMRGIEPIIQDFGPITFDEIYEKKILDVDEEKDEITYLTKSTYTFNRHKSVNITSQDRVTILNPAYMGSILTLATLPPQFMQKYGDHIPKLFQNRSTIFLKARPIDILFNGVKVSCNPDRFPELSLICKTLKGNPPPVLRETDKEGVYFLSLFQRMNNSYRGPFTVNRGLVNKTQLGDTTAYMGNRMQKFWHSDKCNKVKGSDTITWAPLVEPLDSVSTFIPDMCRTVDADFESDISIHGITGSKFALKERLWYRNESECYCPVVDNKVECLPRGLHDVSECQKVPLITSEPHFLHADPSLLSYARGLKPIEKLHQTYIVIEPVTGTPLDGNKKIQLNLRLSQQPVKLLSNVSEGIFPIIWIGNVCTIHVP